MDSKQIDNLAEQEIPGADSLHSMIFLASSSMRVVFSEPGSVRISSVF
jgi:hypothetical protein